MAHEAIEKGLDVAVRNYLMSYPISSTDHYVEVYKMRYIYNLIKDIVPSGTHEMKLDHNDFIGYIDLVTENDDGTYSLYDFKYSNNYRNYSNSPQLHLYKHFYELLTGNTVSHLYYLMIPKAGTRRKWDEDLLDYYRRVDDKLQELEPKIIEVNYDYRKVIEWYSNVKKINEATVYDRNESRFCDWCEYQEYCEKGLDYMLLPENKRRDLTKIKKHKLWIYGAPFSGKTTLANGFEDVLMLNTDGNINLVDAPAIEIKNKVECEGRITKTTFAWEIFKDVITELEKKDNTFNTIVVDLLEDVYEHCRLYMYDKLGITHESDDSFRAWDKVRTEFLSTMKRLINLDYENIILISHEDATKDITRRNGEKFTSIKPNIPDKVALKVAGMVDIVLRAVKNGDDYTLQIKSDDVVFGGGRLKIDAKEIDNNVKAVMDLYGVANEGKKIEEPKQEEPKQEEQPPTEEPTEEQPKPRVRKRRVRVEE